LAELVLTVLALLVIADISLYIAITWKWWREGEQ
jgi:hypothetical protein